MKNLLLVSSAVFALTVTHAQTNVSGGIFSNTTWTKVNSPYVVTSNVVVHSGVILTIQPGVTVKFDTNQGLEINQGKLIAIGTNADSITFTSNSPSPSAGDWSMVKLYNNLSSEFYHCNFRYANYGIYCFQGFSDSALIKNSLFDNDSIGIYGGAGSNAISLIDSCVFINNISCGLSGIQSVLLNHCKISHSQIGFYNSFNTIIQNSIIDSNQTGIMNIYFCNIYNCYVSHNQIGIDEKSGNNVFKENIIDSNSVSGIMLSAGNDSVINCKIRYNGTGVNDQGIYFNVLTGNLIENNSIGIQTSSPQDNIYCNKICNNTTYNLSYNYYTNTTISNNDWCDTDTASIQALIYDGRDFVAYGLVNIMPIDTLQCYLTASVNETFFTTSFSIFPNPFSTQTTLQTDVPLHNATLMVDNCFGQTVAQIKNISGQTIVFNRDNLASGLYFVRLTADNKVYTDKLVIADK